MNTRKPFLAAAAGLTALGLLVGNGVTSAQTAKQGHGAALRGTIQSLGSGTFQLKTSTGALSTVTYSTQTRVSRIVGGSTSDLKANARVTVKLTSGTTTVTAVSIEPTYTKPTGTTSGTSSTHPARPHPTAGTGTGTKTGTKPTKGTKPTTGTTRTVAGGQVVSLNGNTLILKGRGGTNVSYTLASNVKISKTVAGTTSDLAQGETVQILVPATGAAREIVILAS